MFIYLHYFTSLFCVRELGIHRETGNPAQRYRNQPLPFPYQLIFFLTNLLLYPRHLCKEASDLPQRKASA